MILVPRQLARSGMTGNVPYYGGRFTPSQAYAAAHPRPAPPSSPPPPPPPPPPSRGPSPDTESALRHLLESGVLSEQEYAHLLARVRGGDR
jgi:hypothetical protein